MVSFLLEVGVEELPADFVESAIAQWKTRIPQRLEEEFLQPEQLQVYGTPRRLAVVISGLPSQQPDREEELKGPPVKAAFKDGKPTKAAEGFARKQGVAVEDFEIRDTPKGEFVFVQKKIPGRQTKEILPTLIPQWIFNLEGRRFMRWGDGDWRFPRPLRWLVALLDETVLPLEWVNGSSTLNSDRLSEGHRVLHRDPVSIAHAADYVTTLQAASVIVDPQQRQETITEQIQSVATATGGIAEIDPDLLKEVTNLVESPSAVVGTFDSEFLSLPPEVITTVMVTHQRYFPLYKGENLLPNFITISNGDPAKSDIIAAGNGRVIRARLADAQFFWNADLGKPLEEYVQELETITFQEKLGSVGDKVKRLGQISGQIAAQLNLETTQKAEIERTALLCKADLVSQMVYEFPELQGVMGEKYALASGESEIIAKGIFEHYLPRGAEDDLPTSLTGQVVGLSDRLDTLVGIFGLGMIPTGSSDPFALRRAANAIVNIIWDAQLPINLEQLLEGISADFITTHPDQTSPVDNLKEFFAARIRTLLQEEKGIDYDLVNAVLGENDPEYCSRALQDLLDVCDRAQFLQNIRNDKTLDKIYETINRSTRLAVKGTLETSPLDPTGLVEPKLFEQPSEQAFYEALGKMVPTTRTAQEERNYQLLVDALGAIAPTVSEFFDGETSVLVMAEDPAIKKNRLNLLGLLRNHARILGDFGAIVKG